MVGDSVCQDNSSTVSASVQALSVAYLFLCRDLAALEPCARGALPLGREWVAEAALTGESLRTLSDLSLALIATRLTRPTDDLEIRQEAGRIASEPPLNVQRMRRLASAWLPRLPRGVANGKLPPPPPLGRVVSHAKELAHHYLTVCREVAALNADSREALPFVEDWVRRAAETGRALGRFTPSELRTLATRLARPTDDAEIRLYARQPHQPAWTDIMLRELLRHVLLPPVKEGGP